MALFIKAEPGSHNSVIYTDNTGKYFRFSEGTWAWRNHNPGNVTPGKVSKRHGQIGTAGGFAVFPDRESGHASLIDSLTTTFYNQSIEEMAEDYAPRKENNTDAYIKYLRKKTGVTDGRKIKDFTPEEFQKLWQAIEQMEGYKEGKVIEVYPITHVLLDKMHVISSYYIGALGWITKANCIEFSKQGKVDADICISKLNNTYLRARHGSSFQDRFSELVVKNHGKPTD
jgi:hypothetical protein